MISVIHLIKLLSFRIGSILAVKMAAKYSVNSLIYGVGLLTPIKISVTSALHS